MAITDKLGRVDIIKAAALKDKDLSQAIKKCHYSSEKEMSGEFKSVTGMTITDYKSHMDPRFMDKVKEILNYDDDIDPKKQLKEKAHFVRLRREGLNFNENCLAYCFQDTYGIPLNEFVELDEKQRRKIQRKSLEMIVTNPATIAVKKEPMKPLYASVSTKTALPYITKDRVNTEFVDTTYFKQRVANLEKVTPDETSIFYAFARCLYSRLPPKTDYAGMRRIMDRLFLEIAKLVKPDSNSPLPPSLLYLNSQKISELKTKKQKLVLSLFGAYVNSRFKF